MKEWSDDELDELFRQSAEEFEPIYQPNDWQDLRLRLDEAEGVTGGGGWLKGTAPWLAGLLLLLLGGLGAYYYGNEDNGAERHSERVASAARNEGKPAVRSRGPSAVTIDKSEGRAETGDLTGNKAPSQPTIAGETSGRSETQETAAASEAAPKGKELPRNPASVSGVRKPTDPDGKRGEGSILLSNTARKPRIAKNPAGNGSSPAATIEKSVVLKTPPNPGQNGTPNKMPQGALLEESVALSLRDEWPALSALPFRATFRESAGPAYPAVAYSERKDSATVPPNPTNFKAPVWSVRIGISPDLSMVRMSEMMQTTRPGPSVSLLLAYDLNYNLAIQTGVIRSLKTYNAQFDDYNGSEDWGSNPMPMSVDGDCRVFEIPLNLRYNFGYQLSPRQTCLWFVSAGVSSYKMQRETYTYQYDSGIPDSQKRSPKEMDKGTGWYFLSHASVSVGYEHRLTRQLSFVAEPYLRVPLREVGFGKVNLFSTGLWFSVRYTPVFRK